jgi:hypothetical protein
MDITEIKQKGDYNDDVKKLMDIFKFDKINLELKGSSALKIIDYYADYDFFTEIKYKYSVSDVYNEFSRILKGILENKDTYFIEFKIQDLKNKKQKWFPNEKFTFKEFEKEFNDNIDYCKIDIVYFSDDKIFIESSCIYKFSNKKMTTKDYLKQVKDDIIELKKDKNYYKILKRSFLKFKINNDQNKMDQLITVFNSDLGKIYKDINNIDAIELIKKNGYDKEALTKKRIEVNLDEIKYYANYKNQYDKNKKELNNKAKKIYNDLK